MDEQGLAGDAEGAWTAFRTRLADRLVEMDDGDAVVVQLLTGLAEVERDGGGPVLRFGRAPDGAVRAELASDDNVDERLRLGSSGAALLPSSWRAPDEECPDWHQCVPTREVDRLAADVASTLRVVYGVLHPVFLSAGGLERDPADPVPDAPLPLSVAEPGAAVTPNNRSDLVALVDTALLEMSHGSVEHDEDGDVAFRVGLSVVFVRVLDERPAVELFAELVTDVAHPERLPVELDILNRTHRLAKFYVSGTAVRMSHELVAWPFSPEQLRVVLEVMLDDVDTIAESLALRVAGKRFLEMPEAEERSEPAVAQPEPAAPVAQAPTHPGMLALLEMLHIGPVSSPAVAALFERDRTAITRHCTGIRMGLVDCGSLDQEEVLTTLRRGLRHVVSGEVPERRRPLPPRQRTEQPSLLDDGETGGADTPLDFGWST